MEFVLTKSKRSEDHLYGFLHSWTKVTTTLIERSFNTQVNGMNISFWQMTKKLFGDKYRDNAVNRVCCPAEREHLSPVRTSSSRKVQIKAGFH